MFYCPRALYRDGMGCGWGNRPWDLAEVGRDLVSVGWARDPERVAV